jgi:16S rRNA (uracil1498-N3)-methyltransferase
MECFIVAPSDVVESEHRLLLRGDEAHHAIRSLRMHAGETLVATDLSGICYRARLRQVHEQRQKELIAECEILEVLPHYHESGRQITLALAILQQPSRFEEIIEKTTELGVTTFIPLLTERTEKRKLNVQRIERLLREATKQVSRACMPVLDEPTQVKEALRASIHADNLTVILHEAADIDNSLARVFQENASSALTLFIGPEGGFTEDEVAYGREQGAMVASLGARRLRAETAAIAAVSLVSLLGER